MRADRAEHEGVGGKPDGAALVEIPLTNGGVAIIDASDLDKVSKHSWRRSPRGYAVAKVRRDGRSLNVWMHRLIVGDPDGLVVGRPHHAEGCMSRLYFMADHTGYAEDVPVNTDHVRRARQLLRAGHGLSSAATMLGVSSRALDEALWRYIDWSLAAPSEEAR